MELPDDVLQIIREYSKPLTRPDWRCGSRHAILIQQSPIMKTVISQIQHELRRIKYSTTPYSHFYNDLIRCKFPGVFEYKNTDYIQQYGEELLDTLSYQSAKGKHMNFYYCARNFLNDTTKFRLIKYYVEENEYYEWILEL